MYGITGTPVVGSSFLPLSLIFKSTFEGANRRRLPVPRVPVGVDYQWTSSSLLQSFIGVPQAIPESMLLSIQEQS